MRRGLLQHGGGWLVGVWMDKLVGGMDRGEKLTHRVGLISSRSAGLFLKEGRAPEMSWLGLHMSERAHHVISTCV